MFRQEMPKTTVIGSEYSKNMRSIVASYMRPQKPKKEMHSKRWTD